MRRHRDTVQCGWRLPRVLVKEITSLAEREGVRPSHYAARILEQNLELTQKPITAAELAKRLRYPLGW
jgi:hypothetical protein